MFHEFLGFVRAEAHVHHDSHRGSPLDGGQDALEAGHGRGSSEICEMGWAPRIWPESVKIYDICSLY